MREQPEQSYYPAAKVRLVVRLEDFGASDLPRPPAKPPQLRTGKGKDDGRLRVVERDGALVLLGPGDSAESAAGGPQKATTSADDRTHAIEGVVPSTMTVCRNGARTADTLTASFRFADLPLDPRAIRAIAVEAYIGTIAPDDHAVGAAGGRRTGPRGSPGEPLLVLPDEYVDPAGRKRTNLRFSGWADSMRDSFDDDGPTIEIEATDNTRLLIEQDAPPKLAVSPGTPLDRAVADYLSNFPQCRGLSVEYRPAGTAPPRLDAALARTAYKPKLGPAPTGNGASKLTVWDYLTDVCGAVGHVVRVEGVAVVIQRARTLYSGAFPGRPDDPFTGRVLPGGREIRRRLYIHGRNLKKPVFERKFARFAPFNVEVRCYDGSKKRTLVARYPLKGDRVSRPMPGEASEQTWRVFPVTGIRDEATMRIVAQGIYETLGRCELEVGFETKALGSFGGSNFDPDSLDALPGDAVDVEILRDADSSTVGAVEEAVVSRPEAFLTGLGFDPAFARAYAKAVANVGLTTTYRVRASTLDWDKDDGITVAFRCVNYLEVRSDKSLGAGEEPATPPQGATPAPVGVEV